ncbi:MULTISPECIES: hydroxyethylthiazole kinase [Enterococcus]|uniref:hydroxyethylthiazole kinase n=1 Tax=Enterococcus sp. AZ103 TaxID=2774628 RepID=UPI003F201093
MKVTKFVESAFPLTSAPLIQCITNEVTCESVANALLYVGAKPIMADDPREFKSFLNVSDGLLLNLGHISPTRELNIILAAEYAHEIDVPIVVDLVGAAASPLRIEITKRLLKNQPTVVKGNISEMRSLCELGSEARGVDVNVSEQTLESLKELQNGMIKLTDKYPETVFFATGEKDLVCQNGTCFLLSNGVAELDCFTGTGDIVGALCCALLGEGLSPVKASVTAITYFNLAGEVAKQKTQGLANFRQETLNQLSLLSEDSKWWEKIKGEVLN